MVDCINYGLPGDHDDRNLLIESIYKELPDQSGYAELGLYRISEYFTESGPFESDPVLLGDLTITPGDLSKYDWQGSADAFSAAELQRLVNFIMHNTKDVFDDGPERSDTEFTFDLTEEGKINECHVVMGESGYGIYINDVLAGEVALTEGDKWVATSGNFEPETLAKIGERIEQKLK